MGLFLSAGALGGHPGDAHGDNNALGVALLPVASPKLGLEQGLGNLGNFPFAWAASRAPKPC